MALAEKQNLPRQEKKRAFERLLPFATIATVTDIVPLIKENRLLVKRGLQIINTQREKLAPSLKQFLDVLHIKDEIDTYHCGFII